MLEAVSGSLAEQGVYPEPSLYHFWDKTILKILLLKDVILIFIYYRFILFILGVPCITANIYCKSRNRPSTDKRNYSIDLR